MESINSNKTVYVRLWHREILDFGYTEYLAGYHQTEPLKWLIM